jgi:hypothetical protein
VGWQLGLTIDRKKQLLPQRTPFDFTQGRFRYTQKALPLLGAGFLFVVQLSSSN